MSISLTIDSTGSSLSLNDRANGFRVTSFDPGNQPDDSQWASSADTEGARRANTHPVNRTVVATVIIEKATDVALQAAENSLSLKIAKLNREGGELLFTYPSTSTITFDVEDAYLSRVVTPQTMRAHLAEYTLTFICRPYGRGAEVDLGDNTETTLPCLIFTEATIAGDVPALGRLVIDEDDADNQWWLTWGIQSRYYSSSANAALFYEAEGRTAMGGSATAVGPSGASGGGSNVMRNTALLTTYQAILSTQATGAGAHLSHVGTFRVYARVQVPATNTGTVSVALEWSQGDFLRATVNATTEIMPALEGSWALVDLGLVAIKQVHTGTQRWEGRVLARSTTDGDDIDLDYLMFVPVDEGSGIASAVARITAPTTYVGQDSFTSTTAGNALNGRVAPTGGTWATSGAATDITFADTNTPFNEYLSRSATGTRYAILGSTDYANVVVQALIAKESGLIARWTDSSNHLKTQWQNVGATYNITKVVGGTETVLATSLAVHATPAYSVFTLAAFTNGQVILIVTDYDTGTVIETLTATDPVLATGGTLATGEPGVIHENDNSVTMAIDNFYVWQPATDAAIFASQSLEIRHDRVTREDSSGAVWANVSSYQGDYLLVPPSGAEARTARVIVKASRNAPGEGADGGIDDISARLFVTPRYLVVPA